MHLATYGIVVASTVMHAYWNFLIKRSGGGQAFVGLSKVLEAVVFLPIFVVVWQRTDVNVVRAWPLIVVGAGLTLSNYLALGRAYETGDMSVVYPVARGATLLFLPALGFLAFGERMSTLGWVALACIVLGIVVLQLPASGTAPWSRSFPAHPSGGGAQHRDVRDGADRAPNRRIDVRRGGSPAQYRGWRAAGVAAARRDVQRSAAARR